jgi:DnaK suppressor protein
MPTKRAAAKPAKPKKAEKPKLTAKKPATKPVAAKSAAKPTPTKATATTKAAAPAKAVAAVKPAPAPSQAASATPVAQAIRKTPPSERIVVTANGIPSAGGITATPRPVPGDGEADESLDAGSLLAGAPQCNAVHRQAWRGVHEQGAARALSQHPQQLEARPHGRSRSHRLPYEGRGGQLPDPNDRATQEEEFSLELRTRDRERKLIRKIDEALKRVEDGSYGYCLETGEEIGVKRLEAARSRR